MQMTKNQSSTFRELKAAEFVLLALHSHLSGTFVKLYSDNQKVVRIVNVGSMKRELQNIHAKFNSQLWTQGT